MKVLVIGSGGREHALCWKLAQSPLVDRIFCAPGNGGTAEVAENVAIKEDDPTALLHFAKREHIGLVVPGPELPLTLGIADLCAEANIPCFGPGAHAARLEGSKSFAKAVMLSSGVPTAPFAVFDDFTRAKDFVTDKGAPIVIKADGLAAGKGVVVCRTVAHAVNALEQIMVHAQFGPAGREVIVEEMLVGEEVSFLAFCDGNNVVAMPASQDHKPVGEGDTGDNTGGMGAFSPAHVLPEASYAHAVEHYIRPIVETMRAGGHPFVGILYAGLILTEAGPKVLEYNVRFGDPECQPLLARLDADLAAIMLACVNGTLDQMEVAWKPQTSVCVVMAAKGYPGAYAKGMTIGGIAAAETDPAVKVFQAGTKLEGGKLVSSGGRVLGVTALGDNLSQARERAYAAVDKIHFDGAVYRRDIGAKGLKWEPR